MTRSCTTSKSPLTDPAQQALGTNKDNYWLTSALVVFSYIVACWLGQLLVINDGYSSLLWPASGVAWAALLIKGCRYWPSVLLGALLFHVGQSPTSSNMVSALLLSVGPTLQALLGAYVSRRFVSGPVVSIAQVRKLWLFLIINGPVVCLIAPCFAVATASFLGATASFDVFSMGLSLWVSNCIGVLLFGPIFILWWPTSFSASILKKNEGTVTILVITAFLLGIAQFGLDNLKKERSQFILENKMQADYSGYFVPIMDAFHHLEDVERFFSSTVHVTPQEFKTFTANLKRSPGIRSVGWLPRIRHTDRRAYEKNYPVITEFREDFRWQEAGEREEYFPVTLFVTKSDQYQLQSNDISSYPPVQEAIRQAVQSGTISSTGLNTLFRDERQVFQVFWPVYSLGFDSENASLDARAGVLKGFVFCVFDFNALLAPFAEATLKSNLLYRVTDITHDQAPQVLVDNLTQEYPVVRVGEIVVANRLWQLDMQPSPLYLAATQDPATNIFLLFELLIALLISGVVLTSVSRNIQTERLIAERTTDLEKSLRRQLAVDADLKERSQQLDFAMNISGVIVWELDILSNQMVFNDRFFAMAGTSIEREGSYRMSQKQYLNDFVHPDDRDFFAQHDIGTPIDVAQFEYRLLCRDGNVRYVTTYYGPLYDNDGHIVKVVGAVIDNTSVNLLQKNLETSETQLLQLNAELEQRVKKRTANLQEKELFITLLLENLAEGVAACDSQGRIVLLNKLAREWSDVDKGINLDTFYAKGRVYDSDGITPLPSHRRPMSRALAGESVHDLSYVLVGRDQIHRNIIATAVPLTDDTGKNLGALLTLRDFTRRLQTEKNFRDLFELAPEATLMINTAGVIIKANKRSGEVFGWNTNDLCGQSFKEVFPSSFAEYYLSLLPSVHKKHAPQDFKNIAYGHHRDGRIFPIEISLGSLQTVDGQMLIVTLRDISERLASEQAMREAMAMLDAMEEAAFIFDPNKMQYTYVNREATTQLGYSKEEFLAISPTDPRFDLIDPEIQKIIAESSDSSTLRFSSAHRHKDGHEIPVEISIQVININDGARRIIATARDITETQRTIRELQQLSDNLEGANQIIEKERDQLELRVYERTQDLREANQQLEEAIGRAEDASKAKSRFLATMSHEIRTPMNGIIGMIDVLEQTSLKNQQIGMVRLIRDSSALLLNLIEDILDFSKIEAGKLTIEPAPMSIESAMEDSCALLDRLATSKQVELRMFIDPAIPVSVIGDALRLQQILINLINNGVKFSSELGRDALVSVRASVIEQTVEQVTVEFVVVDNGIGMNAEHQSKLFTPFTQSDGSITRRFGGTGLGLSICQSLVKLMGGAILVDSELDKGSTFTVRLTFDVADNPAPQNLPLPPVAGLHCLVFGADHGIADDLAIYLQHGGATVERVSSLDAVREARVPAGLGVWVVDETNAEFPHRQLKAITAHKDADIRIVLIEKGRRREPRYLSEKLLSIDSGSLPRRKLLNIVAMAAGLIEKDQIPTQELKKSENSRPISREEAVISGRLVLIAEDCETNQRVILQQLSMLGYTGDVANDGVEAFKHWTSGDYALLLTDLHMPNMDGLQLARSIRAKESLDQHIPIIVLTADVLAEVSAQCREVGIDEFLSKPIRLNNLQAALKKWMPNSPRKIISPLIPDESEIKNSTEKPVNVSVLEDLIGNDPAIIADFLSDFRGRAIQLADEIQESYVNDQLKQVGAIAHKLKSSAFSIGAIRLGEISAEIEKICKSGDMAPLADLLSFFSAEVKSVTSYLEHL